MCVSGCVYIFYCSQQACFISRFVIVVSFHRIMKSLDLNSIRNRREADEFLKDQISVRYQWYVCNLVFFKIKSSLCMCT